MLTLTLVVSGLCVRGQQQHRHGEGEAQRRGGCGGGHDSTRRRGDALTSGGPSGKCTGAERGPAAPGQQGSRYASEGCGHWRRRRPSAGAAGQAVRQGEQARADATSFTCAGSLRSRGLVAGSLSTRIMGMAGAASLVAPRQEKRSGRECR